MPKSFDILTAANARMEALLPEKWERDEETGHWVRRAEQILRKGQNQGMILFARQYRSSGSRDPFRSVIDLRSKNGDRVTLEDGRESIAGWHPEGLGDPFNLDIGEQLLNQALNETIR